MQNLAVCNRSTTSATCLLIDATLFRSATPAAFAAMWTCLVLIVLSVMGTIIMRKVSHFALLNYAHDYLLNGTLTKC